MAENKKSFVLYCELIQSVKKLTDQQAGKLFKIILMYVNDENPKVDNLILDLVFEPIKQQLKRDLKRWEKIQQVRAEAGRQGGKRSGESRGKRSKNEANEANASFCEANEAVNVNVNVNDNVNVSGNKKREPPAPEGEFLSSLPEGWNSLVKIWLDHKNAKHQKYKGKDQLEIMYQKLHKVSRGNIETAKEIIENSIAFNYSGFFELNNNINNGINKKSSSRNIDVEGLTDAVFTAHGL